MAALNDWTATAVERERLRLELEAALSDETAVLASSRQRVRAREEAVLCREATATALLDQAILLEGELATVLALSTNREAHLGRVVASAVQWAANAKAAAEQAEELTGQVEREAEYVGRRAVELQAEARRQAAVAAAAVAERAAAAEVGTLLNRAEVELAAAKAAVVAKERQL